MEQKTCSRCGEDQPLSQYRIVRRKGSAPSPHSWCRSCENAAAAERAAAAYASEDGRERQRINAARQHERTRERRAGRTAVEMRA